MNEQMSLERFESVKKMLESSDPENHVVALSIIEEWNYKANLAFILLAKKASHASLEVWRENAPTIVHNLETIKCIDISKVLTYKDILQALREKEAPYDQIKFYLDTFAMYLRDQLASIGYDFIEGLEFKIKLKEEYEQRGELSQSE